MKETIVIENCIIKDKKNGDKYLAVKSDKGWFNCFDNDVADELLNLRGSIVAEYVEKNGFKTIVGWETIGGGVTMPALTSKGIDKDRLIVRQSCLKAAIELFNNEKVVIDKDSPPLIEWVLKRAEEFENWVFR